MPLLVYPGSVPAKKAKEPIAGNSTLIGKTVFFSGEDGLRIAGLVKGRAEGAGYEVRLAIPDENGILQVSDGIEVKQESDLEVFEGITVEAHLRRFQSVCPLQDEDVKFVEIKDADKNVVDYRDVMFEGYASTFQEITPEDRDGDYVVRGAFADTLKEFKKNPVMLMDHKNSVHEIAGSFPKINEDKNGLAVQGKISNAPGLRDIRFKVVEKHLRALSMGGIFKYADDFRGILKVTLFENSLVAVPANQDALFSARSISLEDTVKCYKQLSNSRGLNFKKK